MWYRINANLPEDSSIKNNGDNYTTLIIDKASYSDDGGTYCLNATNRYGTSTICVDLNIYKGKLMPYCRHDAAMMHWLNM